MKTLILTAILLLGVTSYAKSDEEMAKLREANQKAQQARRDAQKFKDVYSVGNNTYSLTTTASPFRGGLKASIKESLEVSTAYCAKDGKVLEVVSQANKEAPVIANGSVFYKGITILTFRCN